MRLPKRYALLAVLLGLVGATLPAIASSEPTPVDAVNEPVIGPYPETHRWSPAQETVIAGEAVTFRNSTEVPHGVEWRSTVKPTCEEGAHQVPVGIVGAEKSGTEWSGKCTFSQAGAYTYYCTVHGAAMSGTITVKNPGEPTVTSGTVASVTETTATLNGTIDPNGKATTYRFNYGTSASYGQQTPEEPIEGSVEKPVLAAISKLAPGTTYHYQLVAKDGAATIPGADRTFTTLSPPGPPTATTGPASALSETEATLKGVVNPDGEPTEYFFEWGTTSSYGHLTSELPAGEDHNGHSESATLTGLAAGTVYHFKLVAKNASAPSSGVDGEFKTLSTPSALPPPSPPITTIVPPPTITQLLTPPPLKPNEAPLSSSALVGGTLKLTAPRHGSSLRGSIEVALAGAGGRLEVDLFAKGSSLSSARGSGSKSVRIGRLLRQSVSAGKVSFSLALTAQGKRALAHRHSLPVTVKIVLTPTQGGAVTVTRSVTLRA
ncbi:MAG: plastocyanin/azurin family copper-binding protein [Solirubrobacteraceae bacterium]